MPKGQKYKSKVVFWDTRTKKVINEDEAYIQRSKTKRQLIHSVYRFDSTHEFKVYLKLIELYGINRVNRQLSIEISPPSICHKSGKRWRCDFGILAKYSKSDYIHYVEAKGILTREFEYTLTLLELFNPIVFHKLTLIFGRHIPESNQLIKNLLRTDFKQRIFDVKTFNHIEK